MRDILSELNAWQNASEPIALATVVKTWGSSPRQAGAKMALTASGKICGSVSGGCVEGAVFEAGVETLASGRPQYLHFGVADETAWQVGLACGGQVDVFVERLEPAFFASRQQAEAGGRPYAVATVVGGPAEWLGWKTLVSRDTPIPKQGVVAEIVEQARLKLEEGASSEVSLPVSQGEELVVFIEAVEPPPTLVMVGGVHIAIALASLAARLGFRTVVVDPRRAFGNAERFPNVDRLIKAWPDEAFQQIELSHQTAVAMLTHDPKIDDPALLLALPSPAFYVGALGSPTTQSRRRARLQAAGLSEAQLARLHGPIGLKLGGQSPEEIALAILAEVVAVRNGVREHVPQPA